MSQCPIRQYHVVGRRVPSENDSDPIIYRMRIFANNPVHAKSRFWYYLAKMKKLKKANGELLGLSEIKEKNPTVIKNFGVWIRYQSRTGTHNMYKEYRDVTLNGAIHQMYQDLGGRHRVPFSRIHIMRTAEVKASQCKRVYVTQFHNPNIKFPLPHRVPRSVRSKFGKSFASKAPSTVA